ncbi:ABC transporter permease [Cryobacterium gelidum]|nr:ABC transporter permease subunit [Cryobacterium gelidum]
MTETGKSQRILLGAVAVFFGLPLVVLLLFSLADGWVGTILPTDFTLARWITSLSSTEVLAAAGRSLLLTVCVVVIDLVLVIPAAYVAVVTSPRVRPIIHALAVVPFALPWLVIAAGMQFTTAEIAPNLFGSFGLLTATIAAATFPYLYWAVENALLTNRAKELSEAAAVNGAGALQTTVRVIIPSIRTGIMSGTLLVAASAFGEFAITMTLAGAAYETLPLWALRMFSGRNPGAGGELAAITFTTFIAMFVLSLLITRIDTPRSITNAAGAFDLVPATKGK